MRNQWSFRRSPERKKRTLWLILLGIALFILGFFSARPLLLLLGLIN
ncbi:MAG: hypothetical protein J6B86_05815 [Clostridia bacterium]|nr:hypothetical protein [Clostridia bacterium]